ncbi:MAG: carboxy terminal-processing peptidase [Exilibacterium sp.]
MRRALFLVLTIGLACSLPAWSKALEALTFTKDQAQTTVEIVEKLADRHYRNQPLNDELSSRYLDQFLDNLDPSKSYFLASDVKEFDKYRFEFDDLLRAGKLEKTFGIFHRYRERVVGRLESIINLLEKDKLDFNFEAEETLSIDREKAMWPANQIAADELWRKRLKSAALNLKLAGKNKQETEKVLKRRYQNQLKRVLQQDNADVFEAMINSFTLLYDPHSNYFSPRSLENFNINMSLSLEGIGAVLQTEDEYTKVVSLVAAGPADKQGELNPADKITAVGQGDEGEMVDVIGWRLDEVVQLIRGPKNTVVRLEVIPATGANNETKTIRINRGKVKLEEQAAKKSVFELTDGQEVYKLGVIDIPAFYIDFDAYRNRDPNYKSTTRDVYRLLNELAKENVDGVILDLRNNGGGSLQEATTLTDLFIDQGPVVQIRQTNKTISRHHRSRSRAKYRGPLVVLTNRLSASATEIFAGAIQDYNRGLVIGSQTFGKGTVQSLTPVHEGQLKITESKFYRVSGESTQHRGVVPDISFPALVDTEEVGESTYDNALPWDQIHAVPHAEYFNLGSLLPGLIKAHKQRVKNDPDYIFMLDQLHLMETSRNNDDTISLNEKTRKKEQDELELKALQIENKRRKAKGLKVYASKEEYKAASEEENDEQPSRILEGREINPDKDPLLTESGYILIDFMQMNKKIQPPQVANF